MKVFPYTLARIAGLPFGVLEHLNTLEKETLDQVLNLNKELQEEKVSILEALLNLIQQIEHYPAKYYLKIIRRDIFNDRNFKIKSFEYGGTYQESFVNIQEQLRTFKSQLTSYEQAQNQFEIQYQKSVKKARVSLQEFASLPVLKEGLQLASHSLLQRIEKYRNTPPSSLNKKSLQTERKLLQYISRIASKTSPFSTFTQLGLIKKDDNFFGIPGKKVRLNNALFGLFKDTLNHYSPFFRQLNIRLNPSLRHRENEWVFLLNTKNLESIQRIEENPAINFIIELLGRQNDSTTFQMLINTLQKEIDADPTELESYVQELIQYGLIEWAWPFSGLAPDWLDQFIRLLENFENDQLLRQLLEALQNAQKLIKDFINGNLEQRLDAQTKAFDLFSSVSNQLLEASNLKGIIQEATSQHLKSIVASEFKITKEKIFFEDVRKKVPSYFEYKDFEIIGKELDRLVWSTQPMYSNGKHDGFLKCFKTNFPTGVADFLEFYEVFYKNPGQYTEEKKLSLQQQNWIQHLVAEGLWKTTEHFHLDWSAFPEYGAFQHAVYPSKGVLVLLAKTEDQITVFADTVFMGHGKMFGRFLDLFPEDLTQSLRDQNISSSEMVFAENVDASIYNPNVHPPLLSLEISAPGSQNNVPADQRISITDLEIRLDESGEKLLLFHKETGKNVRVFDYGFEALENRSPSYQMLTSFGFDLYSPAEMVHTLDQYIIRKDKSGIYYFPRITVGDHLMIRRKGWGIPLNLIPHKTPSESNSLYFQKVNQWRLNLGLPDKVFITVAPKEFSKQGNRPKSDDYKPQFIDFTSPLFIELFAKLNNRIPAFLKIEEMYPIPTQNSHHIIEYLIEWNE